MTYSPNSNTASVLTSTSAAQTNSADLDSHTLALTAARLADDRKGVDIVLLKVSDVSYLADYFVVVTAFSHAQVRAIANLIEQDVKENWNRMPLRVEGQGEGNWVLMDYGDVIVHIFMPKEREFYNLEAFWGHAERLTFAATQLGGEVNHSPEDSVN